MNCPVDGQTLVMSERSGIEIDYCPQCRGVWLDRGELDKIIERSASTPPQYAPAPPQNYPPQPQYDNRGYDKHGYHGKKKRDSWLSELFD